MKDFQSFIPAVCAAGAQTLGHHTCGMVQSMKRAVVLSGGGTKGSYEMGVWRALRELGIDYQIVTGTSIGSINGALMVMQEYDRCMEMWEHIVMEDMMKDGIAVTSKIEDFYNQKKALRPFLKKYVKNKGADISPFAVFIERMVDEESVRKSEIDYGLVTVQFPNLKPFMMTREKIPKGMLKDYILASSAIFPVFPMHKIGEETYLDGCYYDNLPIDLAIEMEATDIIAVDLHTSPAHPNYAKRPYVTYIKPTRDLGGILDFDHELIMGNLEMGYQDTMKTYGKYKGFSYCFKPESLKGWNKSIDKVSEAAARGESFIMRNSKNKVAKAGDIYRMFYELEEHTDGKLLTKEDYFIRTAEICGDVFGMDPSKVYDMSEFATDLKKRLNTPEAYPDSVIFENKGNRSVFNRISELKLQNNSVYLTGCLYYALESSNIDFEEQLGILSYLPHELAAALFLSSL